MAKTKDMTATKVGQKPKMGGLPKPKGMPKMGHHSRPAGLRGKRGI